MVIEWIVNTATCFQFILTNFFSRRKYSDKEKDDAGTSIESEETEWIVEQNLNQPMRGI